MKHRRRQRLLKIRSTAIGILLISLTLFGWYGVKQYQNRKMMEAVAESRAMSETAAESSRGTEYEAEGDPVTADTCTDQTTGESEANNTSKSAAVTFDEKEVVWDGKTYRRNSYIKAILCMGVDRSGTMTEDTEYGKAGQADGIFLIVQDTARNSLNIIMIPRDTMTEVVRIHPDGSYRDTKVTHINVAFAYGDGRTSSCQNMVRAVSHLLGDLPIDSYMAVDTSVIAMLNDAVGGVTVTIPMAGMEKLDPSFTFGSEVTLHGDMAEKFVRYRDTNQQQSAIFRMGRHREYIMRYFETVKEASRKNSQIVPQLFDLAEDYMVTDMQKQQYLKIAADLLQSGSLTSENFYILPGTGISTETFDEYYADQNAVLPMILKLFYREIS